LLLREQWIVNVEYIVYLDVSLIDKEYREKLKHNLKNEEAEFIPYLGRREHFAKVYGFDLVDGIKEEGKSFVCLSTLPRADVSGVEQISKDSDDIIAFAEISPTSIASDFYHTFKEFVYTNQKVELNKNHIEGQYYKVNEGTLCLY
jgi:CRISPR-associated protein Cas5h